jgi:hypothetical protein
MKTFTVFYRWQGREYETVLTARDAAWAVFIAPLQLMAGARVYGIERIRN